jgi:2-C-methyl-D-erythritol 4-phosphate cytidylyltransferase
VKIDAVIVAAGSSTRFGTTDKLFAHIGGEPVICWSIRALLDADSIANIIIVASEHNREALTKLATQVAGDRLTAVVPGGARRSESVAAGVARARTPYVAIHDGARPLIQPADIDRCIERACACAGGAILAVPVTDTIKVASDGRIASSPDRGTLWAAQTPQVVHTKQWLYANGLSDNEETDDAAMMARIGLDVEIVEGDPSNLKITRPADLAIAESIARERGWLS